MFDIIADGLRKKEKQEELNFGEVKSIKNALFTKLSSEIDSNKGLKTYYKS